MVLFVLTRVGRIALEGAVKDGRAVPDPAAFILITLVPGTVLSPPRTLKDLGSL
jgi:hypothetical protein